MTTLETINEDDICHTCGKTYQWHIDFQPAHLFNTGTSGMKAALGARRDRDPQSRRITSQQPSQGPSRVVWPTDPVLRVALINAGVITADDLHKAEELLKTSMGDLSNPGGRGVERTMPS
jgi:hypothetical protein